MEVAHEEDHDHENHAGGADHSSDVGDQHEEESHDDATSHDGHHRLLQQIIWSEAAATDVTVSPRFVAGLQSQLADFLLDSEAADVTGGAFPWRRWGRRLAADTPVGDEHEEEAESSVVSESALHQVHTYIFLIGVMHVFNTVIVGSIGYMLVYFYWRPFAEEMDRRLESILEILYVYNRQYMVTLARASAPRP